MFPIVFSQAKFTFVIYESNKIFISEQAANIIFPSLKNHITLISKGICFNS